MTTPHVPGPVEVAFEARVEAILGDLCYGLYLDTKYRGLDAFDVEIAEGCDGRGRRFHFHADKLADTDLAANVVKLALSHHLNSAYEV